LNRRGRAAELADQRPEGLDALRDFLAEFWPAHLHRLKHAVETADDR
jgi:hypothetical protein